MHRVVGFFLALLFIVLLACCSSEYQFSNQPTLPPSSDQPALPQISTQDAPPPVSETQLLLDTVCTITLYGPPDKSLITRTFDLCAEYEDLLSVTVEGSDIWRINHADGAAVSVSPQTAGVISVGLEYSGLSGGMFDITIGRLSALWDFKNRTTVPPGTDIALALETVDYRQVSVEGDTVRSANPQARLDLGGIAKGYIADRLADFLRESGVKAAVIDLGGNVVVVGEKADGALWNVAIRYPFGNQGELLGVLATKEASVVTSGIYERQFEENGIIYHHILDPNTGMPVRSDIVSVTVISESSMIGDVTTTVALLLGSEKTANLVEQIPGFIGALLVLESGEIMQLGDISFQRLN